MTFPTFAIYSDPLIVYGYIASIAFFVGLYKVFRLLGYIRQGEMHSTKSSDALKSIRYCALISIALIVGAGIFIKFNHAQEDDPAGFFALCLMAIFACLIVVFATSKIQKSLLKNAST